MPSAARPWIARVIGRWVASRHEFSPPAVSKRPTQLLFVAETAGVAILQLSRCRRTCFRVVVRSDVRVGFGLRSRRLRSLVKKPSLLRGALTTLSAFKAPALTRWGIELNEERRNSGNTHPGPSVGAPMPMDVRTPRMRRIRRASTCNGRRGVLVAPLVQSRSARVVAGPSHDPSCDVE